MHVMWARFCLKKWIDAILFDYCSSDFPHLGGQGSWGSKNSTPVKATPGASLNRQKSTGQTIENLPTLSVSSHSSKGKKHSSTKYSGKEMHFFVICNWKDKVLNCSFPYGRGNGFQRMV